MVVEENRPSSAILGSPDAPYINELARHGAVFTDSHAVTHPSQPNYLALFSGSTQGVTDDSCPHAFTTSNVARQLNAAGDTFGGYSESLPATGDLVCAAGPYARKHAPWTNFELPAAVNQPFKAFPRDYATLPTVAFIAPNLTDDMHDGTVGQADTWLRTNMDHYAQWAATHNSLLIVTWDEDDSQGDNRVPTLITGAHVKPGRYAEPISHYSVLHTIEAAYGLSELGQPAAPITDVWAR